jgi:hypothetical protein
MVLRKIYHQVLSVYALFKSFLNPKRWLLLLSLSRLETWRDRHVKSQVNPEVFHPKLSYYKASARGCHTVVFTLRKWQVIQIAWRIKSMEVGSGRYLGKDL